MAIVIEGLDATGKSTLAQRIHILTGWPIQRSEGPEKFPGEIISRGERYLTLPDNTIFDRHPLISQFIYGTLSHKTLPPPYLLQELKRRQPYIIEASEDNLGIHDIKEHDTPEHLQLIQRRTDLLNLYQQFFNLHFPIRYTYTFDKMEKAAQAALAHTRRKDDQ